VRHAMSGHTLVEQESVSHFHAAQDDNPSHCMEALLTQEGGSHYKNMAIQPVEYIVANNIQFLEGCVIKYVSRWENKNGTQDLKKAKHCIELLLDLKAET